MDRQDLALFLGIVAIACYLRGGSRRWPDDADADPPLPEWTFAYLSAFDRFLRGDPDAPFVMREVARQNLPRQAR